MSPMFLRVQLIAAVVLLGGAAALLYSVGSLFPAVLCTAGALFSVALLVYVIRTYR